MEGESGKLNHFVNRTRSVFRRSCPTMAVKSLTIFLALGGFLLLLVQAHHPSEFYSSVDNLQHLLRSEREILARLDKYIKQSEVKTEFLKKQKKLLEDEIKGAAKDEIGFLSNPINAFLQTKRFMKDYKRIDSLMQMGLNVRLIENATVVPTDDDQRGVVEGLSTLQDLYKLDVVEMARGKLLGKTKSRELNSNECYSIGVIMCRNKEFANAIPWLREALRRWPNEGTPDVSKLEILDYLSYALSEYGEYEEAMKYTKEVLKLDPKHESGIEKKKVIQQWLDHVEEHGPKPKTEPPNRGLYEALCRGEHQRPAAELSKLRCRYESSKTPFTRIAPFKTEEASLDPLIVIYHEAVSKKEVEKIVQMSRPLLARSLVGEAGVREVSKQRTSQNGWLADREHPLVRRLSQRTFDMTGLDIRSYESLQVNNYGIGGNYLPHYDWTKPAEEGGEVYKELGVGNRIATLMYYFSDVEVGGATVFPNIGVSVFPKKGMAIFWYNLYRDGTGDERTLHGACPVLIGSKWVANKWIHEYHQEFVRPCDLQPDSPRK